QEAVTAVRMDDRVIDDEHSPAGKTDSIGKAVDYRLSDVDGAGLGDVDASHSRAAAFDIQAAQVDDDAGPDDIDAVDARAQNAAHPSLLTVDCDRFCNRHRAKAARIQTVDDSAYCGLGDSTGKRLAGRRAAARIGIVADARHPGARRLRVGRYRRQREESRTDDSESC